MARGRKGRPVSGWVVIDKPAGPGSTDIVNRVRWAFQAQKAGHTGTLDPDATGVLAIALGEATKCVALLEDAHKAYRFRVAFGAETSTDDAAGEVLAQSDIRPSDDGILAVLPRFRGDLLQVPPQVSAVRVDGARAYDLARDGVAMDLAARPLHVARLEMLARPGPDHADFEMVCGKGGYVRAIARDLGRALGGHAHVAWLRRLWTGPFGLAQAVTMDRIDALARTPDIDTLLLPLEHALAALPRLEATPDGAVRLGHGNPGQVLGHLDHGTQAWAHGADGRALALGHYMGGMLHPTRVFNRDPA